MVFVNNKARFLADCNNTDRPWLVLPLSGGLEGLPRLGVLTGLAWALVVPRLSLSFWGGDYRRHFRVLFRPPDSFALCSLHRVGPSGRHF